MPRFIVAHDVGTSGTKAVLVDERGTVLAGAGAEYPTRYPRPGFAEQEAGDWWDAVCRSTRDVLRAAGVAPSDALGVTFSTQMLGIVPVDARGRVLRRPIIWLDARAGEEARAVMRRFGGARAFGAIADATLGAKDGIPKLLWLKHHEPRVYADMKWFLDVAGYLLYRATGRMVMERTSAAAFGLDLKHDRWLAGIMRYAGYDPRKLAPLVRSGEVVGGLSDDAARTCGLPPGTPVIAGAGDVPAASIGAGAARAGEAHLYLGTSGWVGALTAGTPRARHGMAVIASADPSVHLLLAETETAGACTRWAADQLYGNGDAFREMDEALGRVPPGAHSLLFTPWMYGERVPFSDSAIRSAFLNLDISHTRDDMVRAVHEGVCYQFRLMIESMRHDHGIDIPRLRVVGGGARRARWMQMLADVTGRVVEVPGDPVDAGARGAALIALVGAHRFATFGDAARAVTVAARYEPDPVARARYDELYPVFATSYRRLRGFYHQRALTHPGEDVARAG